jgi:hypothetical protein
MGFDIENLKLTGTGETHTNSGKSATGSERAFTFCPECGSHLFGGIYGKDSIIP